MIFSLSDKTSGKVPFTLENTDIFCFFKVENCISIPSDDWLVSLAASLKLKRNVLILEGPIEAVPELLRAQRWHVGDKFLWLAPRSQRVLLEAPVMISGSYKSLKTHLKSFK